MSAPQRNLPPFGREWLTRRNSSGYLNQGPRVALGARAWDMAQNARAIPIMVLAPGEDPVQYTWPVRDLDVLVFETWLPDDDALERLAQVLLTDGAVLVHTIRSTDLPGMPPTRAGRGGPAWVRS